MHVNQRPRVHSRSPILGPLGPGWLATCVSGPCGMPFTTSALSLALIVQNCALALLAFLEVNAPKVSSNLRAPENIAAYQAGDVNGAGPVGLPVAHSALSAVVVGSKICGSHACLAALARDSAANPGPMHLLQ